eukprot:1141362-Pelagomonas_calceolata.AAC.2
MDQKYSSCSLKLSKLRGKGILQLKEVASVENTGVVSGQSIIVHVGQLCTCQIEKVKLRTPYTGAFIFILCTSWIPKRESRAVKRSCLCATGSHTTTSTIRDYGHLATLPERLYGQPVHMEVKGVIVWVEWDAPACQHAETNNL